MPHGITTDKDNNYWVTDVALHQVRVFSELACLCLIFKPACYIVNVVTFTDVQLKMYVLKIILRS